MSYQQTPQHRTLQLLKHPGKGHHISGWTSPYLVNFFLCSFHGLGLLQLLDQGPDMFVCVCVCVFCVGGFNFPRTCGHLGHNCGRFSIYPKIMQGDKSTPFILHILTIYSSYLISSTHYQSRFYLFCTLIFVQDMSLLNKVSYFYFFMLLKRLYISCVYPF